MIIAKNNPTTPKSDTPLAGRRVLLAEDCIDQGRLFLRFLENAGAYVILECNGHAAVDTLKTSKEPFDAVVMDFQMPQMDGLFATSKMRSSGYSGVIVAITAHDSDELREAWFAAGCDAYLKKPLERSSLIETICNCLNLPQMASMSH